ncbi:MAG: hypothetical protein U0838_06875 [Chloroflexota bacterium]
MKDEGTVASATIDNRGGIVSGTTSAGVTYTLTIPPLSVVEPTEIAIHPLSGTSDLGPIVAGADFTPHGLRLIEPATLEITGLAVPADTVPFAYDESAGSAPSGLAFGPLPTASSITALVPHFSGSVTVDVGKSWTQIYDKWIAVQSDTTPAGRMAAAETKYALADRAEKRGQITADTAAGIRQHAVDEWGDAAADMPTEDPTLTEAAQNPTEENIFFLEIQIGKMFEFARQIEMTCDGCSTDTIVRAANLWMKMRDSFDEKVLGSAETTREASSGSLKDARHVAELIRKSLKLNRALEMVGAGSSGLTRVSELWKLEREALAKACKSQPLDPAILLAFERSFALLGDGAQAFPLDDLEKCIAPETFKAQGRITWTFVVNYAWGDDVLTADLDVVIKSGRQPGSLVFASGSKMDLSYVSPETKVPGLDWGCPDLVAGVKQKGLTIGTAAEGGTDPASDPNPAILGTITGSTSGPIKLQIILPTFGSGDCSWGGMPILCPQDDGTLTGKYELPSPVEWSFSCFVPGEGYSITSSGRVIGGG